MSILLPSFVIGLVVFHSLERLLSPIKSGYATGPIRRGYLTDLVCALVNGPGLSALTKVVAYSVLLFVPVWRETLSTWSWGAQFALFFVVDDFCRYWLHRWYHRYEWLWRIHRVHHSITEMDSISLLRVHVLEGAVKNFLIALPFQSWGSITP
jgi:sterol desaturase/sphingolipid hydroxylase (fatty acid hydroxylase superfamily)